MLDYSKLKVDEIRDLIVSESNNQVSKEDLIKNVKGKGALVELHKEMTKINGGDVGNDYLEDEVEESFFDEGETELLDGESEETSQIPDYNSKEWSSYVLSLFSDEELDNGKPNVHGLRRLTGLLLGDILFSGPISTNISHDGTNLGRAAVTYEVIIGWKNSFIENDRRTFRGLASSFEGNTDTEYVIYPEAVAETRAEARALRKALRINTISSDEITKRNVQEIIEEYREKYVSNNSDELIQDSQVLTINKLCERLEIDVDKFINSGIGRYRDIQLIPRDKAASMIKKLNQYQSNLEIPENIRKVVENEG